MPLTFCPYCSNALTISRTQEGMGSNRFECRTCPYEYILDKTYYDRTEMKRKEVADVMGGKDEWKNADNMATQCPAEDCDGDRAYFYQLQIRSADEPMTTFLKHLWKPLERKLSDDYTALDKYLLYATHTKRFYMENGN